MKEKLNFDFYVHSIFFFGTLYFGLSLRDLLEAGLQIRNILTLVLKNGYEIVRAKLYTLASRYVGNSCLHYEPNCTFTQRDTTKQCKTRVQIWARTSNGTFRCFSVLLPPKMVGSD